MFDVVSCLIMFVYMCDYVCVYAHHSSHWPGGQGVYEAMPLSVEAFRVTKAWASGGSWQEVVATAAMAEGDVFRLLRRTLDAWIHRT